MDTLIYILDLFGVSVFAVTGALAAGRKQMDLFGVIVLSTVTAVGGGTIRDVILGSYPVFWVSNNFYITLSVVTSIIVFSSTRLFKIRYSLLNIADAFGLSVFTIIGTQKALQMGVSPFVSIVMGVMTGVFGGMIRDVLSGEIPLILRHEIYATASFSGAIVYVVIIILFKQQTAAICISVAVTLVMRLAAIKWKISLPVYSVNEDGD